MSESIDLIELQKRQHDHDREHHQDIFNTSYPDRMNHYVLHFSKYVGRLSEQNSNDQEVTKHLEKTLADSFIVALAAANTLNLDIHQQIQARHGIDGKTTKLLAEELNHLDKMDSTKEVRGWLFTNLAVPAGEMANAMESLDHMEPMAVRQVLEEETMNIVEDLLIASDLISVDLGSLLEERWNEIEEESIL
ncbi:hypothetical protein [Haloarcula marina]|uniref:hypothetical protein n=1 Tax=Haloarcula marina TaxID=2961574 RepID=UPI0020B677F2|nr:hypothetical protein [Halomicroarcula marina]